MTTRIIVAIVAIPIIVLIIFFAPIEVFGCLAGVITALAAIEFLRCAEMKIKRRMLAYAAVSAAAIPICTAFGLGPAIIYPIVFLLFSVMFCELMISFRHEHPMDFETVATVLLAGAVMPLLFTALVRLGLRNEGPVLVLLPFVVTFSCDSGAYLIGVFLGKNKLAPRLSPKKTIEGSVGGFVFAIAFVLAYGLILKLSGYTIDFLVLVAYGILGGLACQIGDLSFSAVKRLCGVKDYGNLIPGHGGMLDRFDSMFFTAPLIEILVLWAPAIVI
jgi:phosphatidate cytidylyltransferase